MTIKNYHCDLVIYDKLKIKECWSTFSKKFTENLTYLFKFANTINLHNCE